MATWTRDELDKIGKADELEIAALRHDGTFRKSVIIWVVRYKDDLYVRSGYGRDAAWFRGTQVSHEGHIKAGGIDKKSLSRTPTTLSMSRSTLSTAASMAAMALSMSIWWWHRRHDPQRSNSCRTLELKDRPAAVEW